MAVALLHFDAAEGSSSAAMRGVGALRRLGLPLVELVSAGAVNQFDNRSPADHVPTIQHARPLTELGVNAGPQPSLEEETFLDSRIDTNIDPHRLGVARHRIDVLIDEVPRARLICRRLGLLLGGCVEIHGVRQRPAERQMRRVERNRYFGGVPLGVSDATMNPCSRSVQFSASIRTSTARPSGLAIARRISASMASTGLALSVLGAATSWRRRDGSVCAARANSA